MDLTPIRIPGKNKRDNRKAAIAQRQALKKPRGRPLKLQISNAGSQPSTSVPAVKKTKKRTLQNIKSKRKMTLLEKLPTELLEKVFLYCMNLELPRASPVIAGKLSSETVYLHTVISAFGPTWDKWHGRRKRFLGLKGKEPAKINDTSEGDPKLQSAILGLRWATLSRLLGAKDTWVQETGQDRFSKPEYFFKSQNPPSSSDDGDDNERDNTSAGMTAVEYFNNDFASFSEFMQERDGGYIWESCSWSVNKDVHQDTEIPSSLLLGPWTENNIKLLFWAVKSGARIDWLNSTSGEVALEGLKTAITTGNTKAMHLLQWYGLMEKLDVETLLWTFRNAGGDEIATVNQILRIGNFSYLSTKLKDLRKVQRELSDMEDEFLYEGNQTKLDFVKEIKQSQTLCEFW